MDLTSVPSQVGSILKLSAEAVNALRSQFLASPLLHATAAAPRMFGTAEECAQSSEPFDIRVACHTQHVKDPALKLLKIWDMHVYAEQALSAWEADSEANLDMHNSSASICCRGTPPLLPSEKGNLQRLQRSLHKMELGRSPADAPPGRHRARAQLPAVPGPPSMTPSRASSFSMPALLSSGDDNLKVVMAAHTGAAYMFPGR